MNVLLIGTDRSLLTLQSASARRHAAYADEFNEFDIIVFAKGEERRREIATHARVHPTGSHSRLTYGLDALRIARGLPRPDVVSAQDPFETGLAAWIIAALLNAPLHVQVHTDFLSPAFVRGSLLNRVRRLIAGFVLHRAARIRVVSLRIQEAMEERYRLKAPISVLPIFVDTARYASLARTKHPRFKIALLAVGRLEKEKHFELAIDALKAARQAGHDAGLTIVGSGSEEEHLREQARTAGLERFVGFTGWQDDLTAYFSAADLLLVTSEYEGYGMALVEALAAGIPVLSTDVGIAREAGAIVAEPEHFGAALIEWIERGPRAAALQSYPYASEEEYTRAWSADIKQAARETRAS
jgi:glycosyltransferase involved in cell wall biosynthesis